jgi:hypothetical protein
VQRTCVSQLAELRNAVHQLQSLQPSLQPLLQPSLQQPPLHTWLRRWETALELGQSDIDCMTTEHLAALAKVAGDTESRPERVKRIERMLRNMQTELQSRNKQLQSTARGKQLWETHWTQNDVEMTGEAGTQGIEWQCRLDECYRAVIELKQRVAAQSLKLQQSQQGLAASRVIEQFVAKSDHPFYEGLKTLATHHGTLRECHEREQRLLFRLAWHTGVSIRFEVRRCFQGLRQGIHVLLRQVVVALEQTQAQHLRVLDRLAVSRRQLLEFSMAAARPVNFVAPEWAKRLDEERERVHRELNERDMQLRACAAELSSECILRIAEPLAELLSALYETHMQQAHTKRPHLHALAQIASLHHTFQQLACQV